MLFRGVTFPPEWSNLVYLVIVVSTVAIAHTFHVLVETPANIWLRDRLITAPRKVRRVMNKPEKGKGCR